MIELRKIKDIMAKKWKDPGIEDFIEKNAQFH